MILRFHIPGAPQGKGRARSTRSGKHYTPARTAKYETLIALAGQTAMEQAGLALELMRGPVRFELDVICPIPASWSKKKQAQAAANTIHPTTKPDADNVMKACCDGLNSVVWVDDVQVVDATITKRYGPVPGVSVTVEEILCPQ